MMEPKLRMCLISIVITCLNLGCLLYVVAMLVAHLLRLWLVNLETMLHLFLLHVLKYLYGNDFTIIALIRTWRTTQENSATIILHGSDLD
jgi:hypothetical protein